MENAPGQQIARSATLVSLGNILSRVMGLVRDSVIASVFGATGSVSAYRAAAQVPLTLYEMLVGGMVSSALVPIFSEYADPDRRSELSHVASLVFSLAGLALGIILLLLELGTPRLASALVHFAAPLQAETVRLLRITLLAVLFMGLSGIATALCQALQRFALPAFTTIAFNTAIVTAALVLGPRWKDVRVLAIGLVIGSALQVVMQLPALRDVRLRPVFDLRHPVLRHIVALYAPVLLSLLVAGLGVLVDRNLASRTGESSISWMAYATTLRQFPLGLVSMAISTAILPALARQATIERDGDSAPFCATLSTGLRLVLVLTIPAVVGLLVLARPIVALLFQHGEFGARDTAQVTLALRWYLPGLLAAAIDQPLVFAFYARKDTWRPALVGILSVGVYLGAALPTYRTWGMVGLIAANDLQLVVHAAVMAWLFRRQVGRLRGHGIGRTLSRSLLASASTGGAIYATMQGVAAALPGENVLRWAVTVVAGGGAGLGVYLGLCALLRVDELLLARQLILQILDRVRGRVV